MSAVTALERIPGVSPAVFNDRDFDAIARIAYEEAGIVFSRIAPLVRRAGCKTFSSYVERLGQDDSERAVAIAALTTNHTSFYREPHHFNHFIEEVRPKLLRKLAEGKAVRMWSAGCSSGEEVWSLAMVLLGSDRKRGMEIAGSDLRILASDIAPPVLARAEAATYAAADLAAVPEPIRRCWAREHEGTVTIDDTARSLVRFRELNLMQAWPISKKFDVIFCRNVMIYFDEQKKSEIPARFADVLLPDGFLYIGHSERVTGSAANMLKQVGPTIYRKQVP
jgi:chemotaxis protein methyltransferase CheR